MERRARRFRQNMEKAFTGIAGAVAGMTAAMGGAAAMSAQFEQAMTDVQKVTDEATMEGMSEEIEDMTNRIPMAREELAQLATDAGRMGVQGVEALTAFTDTVARMSFATTLSADRAGKALGRLTKWLNIPAENAENLGAAINELSNNLPANADEIVRTLGKTGQQFEILGAATDTTLALTASISGLADSAERGGTRMRRLIQQLQEPSTIRDVANAIGMAEEELEGLIDESPREAITMLAEVIAKGGEEADKLRETLATTSRSTLTLLANNLDIVNDALEISEEQLENPTSLMREFGIAVDTTISQLKLLWQSVKNVIHNAIGQQANKFIAQIIKNIRAWVLVIEDTIDQNKELQEAILNLIEAALHIGGIITIAGLAFKALSLLMSPVLAITAGLLLMGAAWRYNAWGMREFMKTEVATFFSNLGGAIDDLKESFEDFPESPLESLREFWNKQSEKDVETKIDLGIAGFTAAWIASSTVGAALAGAVALISGMLTSSGIAVDLALPAAIGFGINQILEKKTSLDVKKSQILGAVGGALIAASALPFISTPQAAVGIVISGALAIAIEEIMNKKWDVFIKKADLIDKISHVLTSSVLGTVGAGLGWLVAGPSGAAVGFVLTASLAFAFTKIGDSSVEESFDKQAGKITEEAKDKLKEKAEEKGVNVDFDKVEFEDFQRRITELNKLYNKFRQQGGDMKTEGLERMKELLKEIRLIMDKIDFPSNPALQELLNGVENIETKKKGGPVGFQKGGMAGFVPGTGYGDKIPALLEPGEFVWPRKMVEDMPWIQNMWKRFRLGGKVKEGRTHYRVAKGNGSGGSSGGVLDFLRNLAESPPSYIGDVEVFRKDMQALIKVVEEFQGLQGDMNKVQQQAKEELEALEEELKNARKETDETETALGEFLSSLSWGEEKLAKSMGITVDTLGNLRNAFSTVTSGFMEVAQATGELSAGTSARLSGITSAAQSALSGNWLQAAMDLFTGFMTGWIEDLKAKREELQQKLDATFSIVLDGLEGFSQEITSLTNELAGPFGSAISGALDGFTGFYKMTQQFVQDDIIGMVQTGFSALMSVVTGITSSFIGLLQRSSQWEALQAELNPIWDALAEAFGTLLTPVVALARWLREYLGISKDVGEDMEEIANLNVPSGFKRARKVWEAAEPGQPVGTAGGGGGMAIPDWAKQIIRPIKDKLIPYLKGSKDFLGLIETWAKNAWKWIQKLILEWIPRFFSILNKVREWIANIDWGTIFGYVGDALKWFAENFPDAWELFTKKIDAFLKGTFGEDGFLREIEKIRKTLQAIAKSMGVAVGGIGGAAVGATIGGAVGGAVGGPVGGPVGALIGGGIGAVAGGIAGFLGFQEGGVVTKPVPGIVGEAGPEAVIPLDRLGDFGMGNVEVTINASGDGVADQIIDDIQVKNKRLTGSRSTSAAINRRTYS